VSRGSGGEGWAPRKRLEHSALSAGAVDSAGTVDSVTALIASNQFNPLDCLTCACGVRIGDSGIVATGWGAMGEQDVETGMV